MPEESIEVGEEGCWQTVQFQKSPIMSTYLMAVVVGEFDVIEAKGKADVTLRGALPLKACSSVESKRQQVP